MVEQKAALNRSVLSAENLDQVKDALHQTRIPMRWAIGLLGWHDRYWEDSFPGAFFEEMNDDLFVRPGFNHIADVLFVGDRGQVRLRYDGSRYHLCLMVEGDPILAQGGWSEPERVESLLIRERTTRLIQDTGAFPWAAEKGSFSNAFTQARKEKILIREYMQDGRIVDWRLIPKQSGGTE